MDEIIPLDTLFADEELPNDLYVLVRDGLADQLDLRLRDLPNSIEYLTALRWYGRERLSLLMVAALHGRDEIVRILFAYCEPKYQVELKGRMTTDGEETFDGVTALYCACYQAHFTVARLLIDIGQANVNHGTSDEPSHPLFIHASRRGRLDIVRFLVENGYADVNETRSNDRAKYTALIRAVRRNHISIVKYLLEKGADINSTCKASSKGLSTSPITFAVYRGYSKLVQLLCDAGADTNVKNKPGDTLLEIAVKRRHRQIIIFLLERSIITIDEVELAILSFLFDAPSSRAHIRRMFNYLCFALKRRLSIQIPKVCREPVAAYDYHQECQTEEELDSIKYDYNRIWIEVLLVLERILLTRKDNRLIKVLKKYNDYLLAKDEFDKSLVLWLHIFSLGPEMEYKMELYQFVGLFCKMITAKKLIPIDHFLQVCHLTFDPIRIDHPENIIYNQLCFVILAATILEQQTMTNEEQSAICYWVSLLCRQWQMPPDGQTILHLCITGCQYGLQHRSSRFTASYLKFPNESGMRLILACGRRWLDLDAVESSMNNTALHLICRASKGHGIIKLLLDAGAHVDCMNSDGITPIEYADSNETKTLLMSKSTPLRLKCLCARVIANQRLNTNHLGPSSSKLNVFISLHGGFVTKI